MGVNINPFLACGGTGRSHNFHKKVFLVEAGREKVFIYQRDKGFIIGKIPSWIERLAPAETE